MNYQDKWSRWHDKPCIDGEPSSNNGWIYTAYAVRLGLPVDRKLLAECVALCRFEFGKTYRFNRSPGKALPPMSRDEILGLWWLGFISVDYLEANHWNFSPWLYPKFNLIETLKAAWRCRPKKYILWGADHAHRNAVWKNMEIDLFRFAFAVPIQDRVHMLEKCHMKVPLMWRFYAWVSDLSSVSDESSRLIEWRKSTKKPDYLLFRDYFGAEHPFTRNI